MFISFSCYSAATGWRCLSLNFREWLLLPSSNTHTQIQIAPSIMLTDAPLRASGPPHVFPQHIPFTGSWPVSQALARWRYRRSAGLENAADVGLRNSSSVARYECAHTCRHGANVAGH
eukprot:GHVT01048164.1.p3 GENE.GHVT01048164.1~~GHVT01048164.1.p3  ORF type:complete len:118 (+),score=16.05 GHVT01048164.1:27-380(+)